MSDVPPKVASLHFILKQLQQARWIPEDRCGTPPAAEWTKRGANRLRLLGQALRSSGACDGNRALEWMRHQFAVGFFPPANDPGAEPWLECLEELEITSEADALTLVGLVAREYFPKCGKMKRKLVMGVSTV